MISYIGTKLVNATPMTRFDYNELRGWTLPTDENGDDEGYLVEYTDGGKANHPDFTGYVSWSPKEQFEKAYKETAALDFSSALSALKAGKKVQREGWNGVGMWATIAGPLSNTAVSHDKFWSANNVEFAYNQPNSEAVVRPYFTIKTADNEISSWVPSVGDLLANDWQVL